MGDIKMRKLAAVFVTAALLAGAGALALPAGASTSSSTAAKTSAFCKGVKNFDLPSTSGNALSEKNAAATAKELRKLARRATGSTRSATKTLASAFQKIADGASASDVINAEYAKAAGTFSLAALKCVTANITLPDITLP